MGKADIMQAPTSDIVVHAGAHCCGAEEYQRFLGANRAALTAAGYDLAYPGRGGAPGGTFDCGFPEPRHQGISLDAIVGAIATALADLGAEGRGLILSEHDLAGHMASLLAGRFYPVALKRAEALRQALGRPVDRLVVAIRPYEDLFACAWRRFALDRQMEPFAEYVPAMAGFSGGWTETVTALRDGLEAGRVTVLVGPQHPLDLMAHLVPGLRLADPVVLPEAPAITDSAIAMIQRHYGQGARFAPGQRDRILAFHATQPQVAPETGFAATQLTALRARYAEDLDRLAGLAGVELVAGAVSAVAAE
ncbi:hypothetical protein OEZ60_11545 [Defluviimonas sp. WL0024]|uniref:Lysophospholipase, alpha-beta hydrolase superfamily n=1 Tax=Albidovulum salinarum TaxID=2984153 RepID=A0ABT2X3W0_9RHOB|nr:hypothetical protein [Defluviimonas sp. WL0024]MCU9848639.1 hypothetical protein [Defluviimonas sp. WL0024]